MSDKVSIGRIRGFHGLKGHVKLHPYFSFPQRMESVKKVFVEGIPYTLEAASRRGEMWLVKFQGLESREDVEHLQGKEAAVPKEERFPLPQDHFYVDDLVGLSVYEESGRFLGRIKEVLQTGANDVYAIESPPEAQELPREILLPALKRLVLELSLEEKKVVVKIPEGLF